MCFLFFSGSHLFSIWHFGAPQTRIGTSGDICFRTIAIPSPQNVVNNCKYRTVIFFFIAFVHQLSSEKGFLLKFILICTFASLPKYDCRSVHNQRNSLLLIYVKSQIFISFLFQRNEAFGTKHIKYV